MEKNQEAEAEKAKLLPAGSNCRGGEEVSIGYREQKSEWIHCKNSGNAASWVLCWVLSLVAVCKREKRPEQLLLYLAVLSLSGLPKELVLGLAML